MYDAQDSVVSWMVAGGARIDEPHPRELAHLMAMRDAEREAHRASSVSISPLAWLSERLNARTTARRQVDCVPCAAA